MLHPSPLEQDRSFLKMNIIEAVKSGKPFRRRTKSTWRGSTMGAFNTISGWVCPEFFLQQCCLEKEDILAEDWEIQETKVALTKGDFLKAYNKAMTSDVVPLPSGTPRLHLLLRELGLD